MSSFVRVHNFFHDHPIGTGILGTITSFLSSAGAFLYGASLVLGFVTALFGAGTAVYTFLLVRRNWRKP